MVRKIAVVLIVVLVVLMFSGVIAQTTYPGWTYSMKVWPFDVLYPFDTAFAKLYGEKATTSADMDDNFNAAKNAGANVVICYIDDEQSFETFVSDSGFAQTLSKMQTMVSKAHAKGLKLICYLNGLEVISVGATATNSVPSFAKDAVRKTWLQKNVSGKEMLWYTGSSNTDWIPANSEDAWVSPFSPYRELFMQRVSALAKTGLDGLYVDAAALPGVDNFGIEYASSDVYFASAFKAKTGLDIPTSVNWNSESFRRFVYFRHETIRDYLAEIKTVFNRDALVAEPAVFFEMSACDTETGTYLGNDNQFTVGGGIACSPEIETSNYIQAFRQAKATRDADQNMPMLFLGWPSSALKHKKEFSIALCLSGNYFPTVNENANYPTGSFPLMNTLKPILDVRKPYQNTVLIYPMRSKDNSISSGSTLSAYNTAFVTLQQKHIAFRIVTLETLKPSDLDGISTVVLAGAESISDSEFILLNAKNVILSGTNGTKNEFGTLRSTPLSFNHVVTSYPALPYGVTAPTTSCIEYYTSSGHRYMFVYNNTISGNITIPGTATVYSLESAAKQYTNTIPIGGYLTVIDMADGSPVPTVTPVPTTVPTPTTAPTPTVAPTPAPTIVPTPTPVPIDYKTLYENALVTISEKNNQIAVLQDRLNRIKNITNE